MNGYPTDQTSGPLVPPLSGRMNDRPTSRPREMNPSRYRSLPAALFLLLATHTVSAQSPPSPAPAPAPAAQPAPSPFSGLIFGNFNYMVPTTPGPLAGQLNNAFVLDRVYLTFRMPAGENTS